MTVHQHKKEKRKGQSLVEFALVLPLLLFMFMAIIDFGRALIAYAQASAQVRNALRSGVILGYDGGGRPYLNCTSMHSIAGAILFGSGTTTNVYYIPEDNPGTTIACPNGSVGSSALDAQLENGDILHVEVSTTIELITPFFDFDLPMTIAGQRTLVKNIALEPSYTGTGGSGGDTPPAVSIISPTDGSTVTGTITITASAVDDNGVVQVQFLINGVNIGTDITPSDGWTMSWDTTTVSDGNTNIAIIATDTAGKTGADSIMVIVNNGGPVTDNPPMVTIINPANGSSVTGTIDLTADAIDDVGVASVRFFVDGVFKGMDSYGADGWKLTWDSTSVADGSHSISVTASDNAGQTDSDSVTVDTINGGSDLPPTVTSLTSTASPAVGLVTLTATATDDNGVVQVEFRVDGTSIGTDSNGADGWSVVWNSASVPDGTHSVMALATDTIGLTGSLSISLPTNNGSNIVLVAMGVKISGNRYIELTWSGASTATVNIYRDGIWYANVANTGAYSDPFPKTSAGATYTYKVCEIGGSTACSNSSSATVPN
jgi:hypothetical protein